MDPQGVRGEGLEVHEDHKCKVFYPFKPLLSGFKGPPLALIDTLGVRGIFFSFRVPLSKKVKNQYFRQFLK